MTLKPTDFRLIVTPVEEANAAGIYIPDSAAKDRPEKGKVVAVGKFMDKEYTVGDLILFKKYAPDEYEQDGQKFLIVDQEDILATIVE